MKVVLKVTVYDRILADMVKAQNDNREVDFVVVSEEEHDELRADRRSSGALENHFMNFVPDSAPTPAKASFKVGRFEFTGTLGDRRWPSRYLEVPSYGTFMGKTLYVVPEGYMPR